MSDLVGNPEDRFSRVAAQIISDKSPRELRRLWRWFAPRPYHTAVVKMVLVALLHGDKLY